MKSIFNFQKGFTLVELLASVIVLVAVGSVIAGTIASSLRGASKTNTIENIRQNGNYALNQISKNIEYTLPFDGKNTGLSNDGIVYATNCPYSLGPTPAPLATSYSIIAVESADNVVTRYKCTSSPAELSANGTTSLVDLTSVSLKSCSFSCIQNKAIDIPVIKIKFEIGPENSNGLAENSGSIIFETSVTIRNYKK